MTRLKSEANTQPIMSSRKRVIPMARWKNVVSELMRFGDPTLPSAAARLGTSARSLQRQFKENGITYSDVVNEVRYEIARSLLATTTLDVAEIGATLGYRDPSSFSRAFMRWSGMSPKAYRMSAAAPNALV